MLGIFHPQNKTARQLGQDLITPKRFGFSIPYLKPIFPMSGLGQALGQPPATCPTTAISAESAQAYKTCRATAYNLAVSQCKTYPGPQIECVQPNFYDNFNKANCFRFCVEDCTKPGPIMAAQDALGRPVTGTWTWEDQVALEASGKSFFDVAPGCKGSPPIATPPPVVKPPTAPVVIAEPVAPPVVTAPMLPTKKKMSTANMLVAGGVLTAVAVGGYYVAKKKGWLK